MESLRRLSQRRAVRSKSDAGVRRAAVLSLCLKTLALLALGLSTVGCATPEPPYPNAVPIDTTGNFGAR